MAPPELILDGKSSEEIKALLRKGIKEIENGEVYHIEDVLKLPKEI